MDAEILERGSVLHVRSLPVDGVTLACCNSLVDARYVEPLLCSAYTYLLVLHSGGACLLSTPM
jgi:hypothetical protein